MQEILRKRIEINPKVMVGKPVIKGTRITIEAIVRRLAESLSLEEMIEDYPSLKKKTFKPHWHTVQIW